ncbi:MAG: hypothetical protein LUD17_05550 [Bacteroidales bacterium]|nr:hypothetical protein [Bacteroidales bacterium]
MIDDANPDVPLIKPLYPFWQDLTLIWEKKGKRVYAFPHSKDGEGNPVPTGLPRFIVVEKGHAKWVYGTDAL